MGRLTVDNKTEWDSTHLRRMMRSAEKYFELVKDRKLIVRYGRTTRRAHGRARIGDKHKDANGNRFEGGYVKVWIRRGFPTWYPPRTGGFITTQGNVRPATAAEQAASDEQFVRDVFWLIFHEVAHNRGMDHKDMGRHSPIFKVWDQPNLPPCADDKPYALNWVPKKAPEPKPKKDLIAIRRDRIWKSLERWKKKRSRAEAGVAKCQKRLSYYDRKLTARALGEPVAYNIYGPTGVLAGSVPGDTELSVAGIHEALAASKDKTS